jgi:hypothetical protein
MFPVLGHLLLLLGKLLLLPIRLIIWLEEAITGERRRLEQQRRSIQERPPLSDEAFLERAGVPPEDVPTALATRRAVAEACGFPPTALHPGDVLATLRCLMGPAPDAHWLDLGSDWFEVVVEAGTTLGVTVSGQALDELDERWQAAERSGELANLGQLIGLLAGFVRAARTTCSPGARTRLP